MNATTVNTPLYVLLDGKLRIGPSLSAPLSGPEYTATYSFSDKQPYDLFCTHYKRALTPYPLVKGYLRSQIAESDDVVPLVVVDATGPDEAHLDAATMESVLEAMEQQASQVSISHRLILDHESRTYRVEKVAGGFEMASVRS